MKQKFYKIFRKSIAARLLLLFSLLVGGGNSVVAQKNIIVNGGSYDSEAWEVTNFSPSETTIISDGVKTATIISKERITLASTDRIVISARSTGSAQIIIKTSSDKSTWTNKFTYKNTEISSSTGFIELISDDIELTGEYYLQFSCSSVSIESIKLYSSYEQCISESKPTAFPNGYKVRAFPFKYTPQIGWNTICTPFILYAATLDNIFGKGKYNAFIFNSYEAGTVNFSKVTYFTANQPGLVYTTAPNVGDFSMSVSPSFNLPANHATTPTGSSVTFQGTYAPIAAGNMPSGSYGITNSGQIVNAGVNSSIKGYRAYLTGLPSGASARIMILDDDSDTPTDIGLFKMAVPEAKDVYTLSGQRVQKARKGIYVINGKKIVIK